MKITILEQFCGEYTQNKQKEIQNKSDLIPKTLPRLHLRLFRCDRKQNHISLYVCNNSNMFTICIQYHFGTAVNAFLNLLESKIVTKAQNYIELY